MHTPQTPDKTGGYILQRGDGRKSSRVLVVFASVDPFGGGSRGPLNACKCVLR